MRKRKRRRRERGKKRKSRRGEKVTEWEEEMVLEFDVGG